MSVRQHSSVLVYQYRTSDVAENLGRYLSCTEHISQGNDLELMVMVKMETRHLVEGSFGSEFPVAICSHCIFMVALSRNFVRNICLFGKTTPYVTIFKILFGKFLSRHRSTLLCSNFVKFGRWEIGEIVCYLPDKKQQTFACLSNCR